MKDYQSQLKFTMSKNKNTEKTTKLAVNTFLRHLSILEKVKNKNVESLNDLCELNLKTVEQIKKNC